MYWSKIALYLAVGLSTLSYGQNWSHVGPLSTNLEPVNGGQNLFETGQINLIEVNPWNSSHLVCGGRYAGFWESFDDGASWQRVPSQHLGSNGVGALHFISETEILVSHLHFIAAGIKKMYSRDIGIYNSAQKAWQNLPKLPLKDYIIYDVTAYTSDNQTHILAATSEGLLRLRGKPGAWEILSKDPIQSLKLVNIPTQTEPILTCGGTERQSGKPCISLFDLNKLESRNPLKMVTSSLPLYDDASLRDGMNTVVSSKNSDCLVEFGEIRSAQDFDLFVLSDQEIFYRPKNNPQAATTDTYHQMLYKLHYLQGEFTDLKVMHQESSLNGLSGARTGLVYDAVSKGVFYSGVKLNYASDPTYGNASFARIRPGFKTGKGTIHDDIHELRIYEKSGDRYLIAACDGGITRSKIAYGQGSFNPHQALYFEGLNNGLHVMLVNGFSGASLDPDFYVAGGFDIINTDFFRADLGRNEHTESTWENAGALVDQFDNSRVIIDVSMYNQFYRVVEIDSNRNYKVSPNRSFHAPVNPGQAPIRANPDQYSNSHASVIGFQSRNFVQDPYRPGRIFYVKHKVGLHQFDPEAGLFVRKLDLAEMNPEPEWAGWSNDWRWWRSVSFSPQTPNSMHIIINGSDNPENKIQNPMVIKYVGQNLDACQGLDHTRYGEGGAQWELISERLFNRFNRTMGTALTKEQIRDINLIDVATSPHNPNRIYMIMRSKIDTKAKIVVFTGTKWMNYGANLPDDEFAMAMIMDYKTKDGIYLATDKNIYYRELGMPNWICVSGNFPMLNVEQLEINYLDNTLRAGTFGLGIWKMPLFENQ